MSKKIKVGFFMTLNQVMSKYIGILNLFYTMQQDDRFDVRILYTYNVPESVRSFIKDNETIAVPYNHKLVSNYNDEFDLIITIDPYYGPHCKGAGYRDWTTKILYKEYGVSGITDSIDLYSKGIYDKAWRIVTDCKSNQESITKELGVDKTIVGNPLFDYPFTHKVELPDRPRVLWTPHCTLTEGSPHNKVTGGRYSTFLEYKDLFIDELPNRYPMIDFIVKPHPYIPTRLKEIKDKNLIENFEFDYDKWISEISKNPNVFILSEEEDYYYEFLKSSVLLNDSISFMAEYLPTQNPIIVLRDYSSSRYSKFTEEMIDKAHYQVYNKYELYDYLDKLVITYNDDYIKKLNRLEYLNNYKVQGYSSNSQYLCDYIYNNIEED